MLFVLGLISLNRLADDPARDPVIVNVGVTRCARDQLRAIDRDDPGPDQATLGAQLQHQAEQVAQPLLVTHDEPGDGRVIRHTVTRDHPIGDVLTAVTLNPTRGPLTRRIRIHQQAHHLTAGSYAARPCPSTRYAA